MGDMNTDQKGGSAGPNDPKSQAAPGPEVVINDPVAVLQKNKELLTEKEQLKARLNKLEAEEQKRQEDEAKKRGDYEKLLTDKDAKIKETMAENKRLRIGLEATKLGLIDTDYIKIIADTVADDFTNLTEVMTNLKTTKPYLFGQAAATTTTAVNLPGMDKGKTPPAAAGKIFTKADLSAMKPAEYAANKAVILEQFRQGLIK